MNPQKAIEILSMDLTYTYPARFDDLQKAVNLGKEALKAELKVRQENPQLIYPSLPGETEE